MDINYKMPESTYFKNDFLDYIAGKFGRKTTASLQHDFFEASGLPVPSNSNEWFASWDSGVQVFMDDPAVIMRIRSPGSQNHKTPHILQPIARRVMGRGLNKLLVEFVPGIKVYKSRAAETDKHIQKAAKKAVDDLKTSLWQDGYKYWDAAPRNTGILPDGSPVVIDVGAVNKLTFSIQRIKKLLRGRNPTPKQDTASNPQDEIFSDLKSAFEQAWPQGERAPRDMLVFWKACKDAKEQGVLKTGWKVFFHDERAYRHNVTKKLNAKPQVL